MAGGEHPSATADRCGGIGHWDALDASASLHTLQQSSFRKLQESVEIPPRIPQLFAIGMHRNVCEKDPRSAQNKAALDARRQRLELMLAVMDNSGDKLISYGVCIYGVCSYGSDG